MSLSQKASPKILIDEQINAVRASETLARASGEYANHNPQMLARADGLAAALRTLIWVRDNAEKLRAAVEKYAPKERRSFASLPMAQQAAMRCGEVRFQRFMRAEDADGAARAVRSACKVESRKEFDTVAEAGNAWRRLDAEFEAWARGMEQAE